MVNITFTRCDCIRSMVNLTPNRGLAIEIVLGGQGKIESFFCKVCINSHSTFKKVCVIVKVKADMINNRI